jgi:hypothetical protein
VWLFLWLGLIASILTVNWCGCCVYLVELAELAGYEESIIFWVVCLIVPLCLTYKFMLVSFGAKNGGMEKYITMGSLNIFAEIWYYNLVIACWAINFQRKLAQRYLAMWIYLILNINMLNWFSANIKGFGLFLTNFSIILLIISLVYLWNNFENIFSIKGFWILAGNSIACIIDSISWRGLGYFAVFPMIADPTQVKQALINELLILSCVCLKSLPIHEKFDILTGLPLKAEHMFGPRFINGSASTYHLLAPYLDKIVMAGYKIAKQEGLINQSIPESTVDARLHLAKYLGWGLDNIVAKPGSVKSVNLVNIKEANFFVNEMVFSKLYGIIHNIELIKIPAKATVSSFGDFKVKSWDLSKSFKSSIPAGLPELLKDDEVLLELKTPIKPIQSCQDYLKIVNRYQNSIIIPEPVRFGMCIDMSVSKYEEMMELKTNNIVEFKLGSKIGFLDSFHQQQMEEFKKMQLRIDNLDKFCYKEIEQMIYETLATKRPLAKKIAESIAEEFISERFSSAKIKAEELVSSIIKIK